MEINDEFSFESKLKPDLILSSKHHSHLNDDEDARSNVVLIKTKKESTSNGNIKFFGIIKAGKKCVKVAKTPKTRKGFEVVAADAPLRLNELNSNVLPTFDRIHWNDDVIDVHQLSSSVTSSLTTLPIIVKVMNVKTEWRNVHQGQCLMIHQIGTEQRVLLEDPTINVLLSVSKDFKIRIKDNIHDVEESLEEFMSRSKLPSEVTILNSGCKDDDIGDGDDEARAENSGLIGREVLVKQWISSSFLVCSAISAGWIDQTELIILPTSSNVKVKLATKLRTGGDDEWEDYVSSLSRSVRHQLCDDVTGYRGVLREDDTELTMKKTSAFRYENVDISKQATTMSYENIELKGNSKSSMYENVYINNVNVTQLVRDCDTTNYNENNNNNNNNNNNGNKILDTNNNNKNNRNIYSNSNITKPKTSTLRPPKADKPNKTSSSSSHLTPSTTNSTLTTTPPTNKPQQSTKQSLQPSKISQTPQTNRNACKSQPSLPPLHTKAQPSKTKPPNLMPQPSKQTTQQQQPRQRVPTSPKQLPIHVANIPPPAFTKYQPTS